MPFAAAFRSHAIEEVGFRAILKFPLSNEMLQAIQADEEIRSGLPIQELIPQVDVLLQPDKKGGFAPVTREAGLAAVIFSAAKLDGTPAWQLRAEGQIIEVKCRDYVRWNGIWPRASSLLSRAFSLLPDPTELQAVSLHYVDHFVWQGDESSYDLSELILTDSEYVLPQVFRRGPLWHLHQGWFEQRDLHEKFGAEAALLHRLHMNGIRRGGRLMVTLEHMCQLNMMPDGMSAAAFFDGETQQSLAEQTFDGLHQTNKKVVVRVVKPAICEGIGLRLTEAASELAKRIAG